MAPSTYSASNSKIEPLSMINQAQGLAIDVKNLCKKFGNKVAVDNVSIAQPAGSVWGFLGPNGSGKTTTIRMLCGLLEPTSGEGSCLGFDVVKQSREIKNLTGYMTQKFSFWEDLTIKENLDFVARLYEMPNRRKIVEKTLIDLGLEKRQHQLAGSLSGGWKQRLALAAVTMHEPKLLLLDEPTAGVDPQARRDFWQQIHRLSEQGLTVLVSTHYMDEAERCDHIVYLAYGKLITQGTVNEIIQQSGLIAFETQSNPTLEIQQTQSKGTTENTIRGLLSDIQALPSIEEASFYADKIKVSGHDRQAMEQDFVIFNQNLQSRGQPIIYWQTITPTLEDAFIALEKQTGGDNR